MLMASGIQSRPAEQSVTSSTREKFLFPAPDKLAHGTQLAFCPKDRILKLFNKYTNSNQEKLTKPVKEWFAAEALRLGWADAIETPADQAGTNEGITLLAPNNELTRKRRTLDIVARPYYIKADNDESHNGWTV